jgi:hypothetical protein
MLLRSMPVMRRAGSARGDHADITRMSCVSASLRVPRLNRLVDEPAGTAPAPKLRSGPVRATRTSPGVCRNRMTTFAFR